MITKNKVNGTKKKATKFVLKHHKVNNCPACGSKRIEASYGTGGHNQCNQCGHEWLPYIAGAPRKERG